MCTQSETVHANVGKCTVGDFACGGETGCGRNSKAVIEVECATCRDESDEAVTRWLGTSQTMNHRVEVEKFVTRQFYRLLHQMLH